MKLDSIFARLQYQTIIKISTNSGTIYDKLVGINGLSKVFINVVNKLCINAGNIERSCTICS